MKKRARGVSVCFVHDLHAALHAQVCACMAASSHTLGLAHMHTQLNIHTHAVVSSSVTQKDTHMHTHKSIHARTHMHRLASAHRYMRKSSAQISTQRRAPGWRAKLRPTAGAATCSNTSYTRCRACCRACWCDVPTPLDWLLSPSGARPPEGAAPWAGPGAVPPPGYHNHACRCRPKVIWYIGPAPVWGSGSGADGGGCGGCSPPGPAAAGAAKCDGSTKRK